MQKFHFPLIAILMLSGYFSQAQEKRTHLKLYTNYHHESTSKMLYDHNESSFGRITIALNQKLKGRWFQEFELSNISLISEGETQRNIRSDSSIYVSSGYETKGFNVALRYEFGLLLANPNSRVRPAMSLAARPGFDYTVLEPRAGSFDRSTRTFDLLISLVPRVSYRLANRVNVEVNFPFHLTRSQWISTYIDNPQVPERQKRNRENKHKIIPRFFDARLGLSIAL